MHRVRLKIGGFPRRWYGFRVRNDIFRPGNRAGGLILSVNQQGLARILWKYFNAPGNVMFVTVNILTFAGIVTYSSLISANREKLLEERLYLTQEALEQGKSWAAGHPQHQPEIGTLQRDETQDVTESDEMHLEDIADSSALPEYIPRDISLHKKGKCDTYNSQMVRMSLFHMIYAYFLCNQVGSSEKTYAKTQGQASELWDREVTSLREQLQVDSEHKNTYLTTGAFTDQFYDSWRADFAEMFSDLTKSQQFHFPDWKHYPGRLRSVCKLLYNSDMATIEDFQSLYDAIEPLDLKRLLRMWLCDYSHLIKPTVGETKERFYQTLIHDCHDDNRLFSQYSSILFNAKNPRRRLFFNPCNGGEIPSASIDTVLDVLQEYVSLQEHQGIRHYNAIIRLISMIRKDCVMSRYGASNPLQVRILLPSDHERPLSKTKRAQEERKRCFQLVSRNPRAVRLLATIASWQKPTD